MSLYRRTRRRRLPLVAALLAGVAVGFAAGFLAGRATDGSEASLPEALAGVRERARLVSDALDLVTIEYRQAVRDGRVAAQTEYDATRHDVETAQERLAELRRDLEALSPVAADRALRRVDAVDRLVRRLAPATEVEREAAVALEALSEATGTSR